MHRPVRILVAALLAMLGVVAVITPAAASCMFDDRPLDEQIAEAAVVLRGTVVALAHNDTTATIEVSEVWRGSPELRTVVVQGGTGEDGAMTSIDRTWQQGAEYLVFPQPDGPRFLDNQCSPTQPWDDALAVHRPADATTAEGGSKPPGGPGGDEQGSGPMLPLAVGLVVVAAGAAWVATRRRA